MKKKQRIISLIAAAGVLALLCLCLFLMRKRNRQESQALKEMIIPFTVDQMKMISVKSGSSYAAFEKDAGIWKCISDPELHPDQTKVGVLAASVTGVSVTRALDSPGDLSDYGLDDPEKTLTVRKIGEDEEVVLKIGDINDTTMDVYCLKDGTVYAVSTALLSCLDYDEEYYRAEEDSGAEDAESPAAGGDSAAEDVEYMKAEEKSVTEEAESFAADGYNVAEDVK